MDLYLLIVPFKSSLSLSLVHTHPYMGGTVVLSKLGVETNYTQSHTNGAASGALWGYCLVQGHFHALKVRWTQSADPLSMTHYKHIISKLQKLACLTTLMQDGKKWIDSDY